MLRCLKFHPVSYVSLKLPSYILSVITDVGQTATEANILAVIDHKMTEMQRFLADPAQPAVALRVLDGHNAIMSVNELSDERRAELNDILVALKRSVEGLHCTPCSRAEIALFRGLIFR